MNWTELKIEVPVGDLDRAADIAQMVIPYGIYIEDYSNLERETLEIAHIDLIDEELLKKDRSVGLIHIYLGPDQSPAEGVAYLEERFRGEDIGYKIDVSAVREEDWANNWKQYFKPSEIGERLLVCPTWETVEPSGIRRVLRIDPGMAFGTGTHVTTRLCLEALEKYVTAGSEILDVGTGSGILSIASLLLGAGSATGVDIDKVAVRTAVENGELNGLREPEYKMVCGDLVEKIDGRFDIVIANIVADVIIGLSKTVADYMKPDGVFLMSGIVDIRLDDVKSALDENGFTIIELRESEGWVCIAATGK